MATMIDASGQHHEVPDNEVAQRRAQNWSFAPGQVVAAIRNDEHGNVTPVFVRGENWDEWHHRQQPFGGRGATRDEMRLSITERGRRVQRQNMGEFGDVAFATALAPGSQALANYFSGGGEQGAEVFRQIDEANPEAVLAGTLTSFAIPFTAPALGRLGMLGRAASVASTYTPFGLALKVGQGARAAAATRIAGTAFGAAHPRLAALGAGAADVVAQELTLGGLAGATNVLDHYALNRPLAADQIASNMGWGTLVGLGMEGLFTGGGAAARAWRRAQQSPGAQAATGGLQRAARMPRNIVNNPQEMGALMREVQAGDLNTWEQFKQVFSGVKANVIRAFNNPRGREFYITALDELPKRVRTIIPKRQQLAIEMSHALSGAGPVAEGRLSAFRALFREADRAPAAVARSVHETLLQSLHDVRQLRDQRGHAFSEAGKNFLDTYEKNARSFVLNNGFAELHKGQFVAKNAAAVNSEDLYKQTLAFRQSLNNIINKGEFTAMEMPVLSGFRDTLNKFARDRTAFGDTLVDAQEKIDGLLHRGATARTEMNEIRTEKALNKPNAILKAVMDTNREIGDNVFDAIHSHATTQAEVMRDIGAILNNPDVTKIGTTAREVAQMLDEAKPMADIIDLGNQGISQQRNGLGRIFIGATGGRLAVATIGALLGTTLVGGTGGALLGLGAGLAAEHLTRPISTAVRQAQAGSMWEIISKKMGLGRANLKKALASSGRTRESLNLVRNPGPGLLFVDLNTPEQKEEAFLTLRAEMTHYANNPESLIDNLTITTMSIADDDPEVASILSERAYAGLMHLMNTMPAVVEDPLNPENVSPPSTTEIDSFFNRYRAIEDPMSIFFDLSEGTLTPEAAQAVREVYPALYSDIVLNVVETITEHEGPINYQQKIHIGTLLGVDIDNTLNPGFILSMQNNGYQTAQQAEAVQGPRPFSREPALIQNQFTQTQRLLQ